MSRLKQRIENYNAAFEVFSKTVNAYRNDNQNVIYHMALVRAYEIVVELAWKVLKDYLAQNSVNVYLPKEVIKEAFANNVIENGQVWIDMLEARNITSHEYRIEKVRKILELIASEYYSVLRDFKNNEKVFNG